MPDPTVEQLGHTAELLVKQGHEWENDAGERFPAIPLYRYRCSCDWQGAAWYGSQSRALSHFDRHLELVREAERGY